ncbi:MAG: riboflavin synthase [Solimicrobium sp.]|jgi:riboflavin synthase|nr:riboflavin synthase [Solimicrobium sp.]
MFTGIVSAIGTIKTVTPLSTQVNSGLRLTIDAGILNLSDVTLGDSIAINGACMTVVSKTDQQFCVDISRESLNLTSGLDKLGPVNLEKALTLANPIGGHLVSGHIDGLGTVTAFSPVNESTELVITAPKNLAKYLAYKGSIVVNGVSLTVNRVTDFADSCEFSINLIPHTLQVTTLRYLHVGERVNLEVDLIARYVARMMDFSSS